MRLVLPLFAVMLHPCRVHLRHQADTHGISTQHRANISNIKTLDQASQNAD